MTPPARKPSPSQGGGRPARGAVRASPRIAANPPDTTIDSRRDLPHSLPPSSRTSGAPMEYLPKKHGKEVVSINIYEPETYPNVFEDPDPAPPDLSPAELEFHKRKLTAFGDEMYSVFKSENESREEIWLDFISTFRPHSLQTWPKGLTYKWCPLLRSRGVYFDSGRETSRTDALVRLWFRKEHTPTPTLETERVIDVSPENKALDYTPSERTEKPEVLTNNSDRRNDYTLTSPVEHSTFADVSRTQNNWEEDSSSAGSGHEEENLHHDTVSTVRQTDITFPTNKNSISDGNSFQPQKLYLRNGLGIQGLMRSFIGQKTFTESWEADLDSTVSVYDTMANICQINENEKLKAIPIMLSLDALLYYSSHVKQCQTYENAINALCLWYSNADERGRILTKWQSLRLTEELTNNPEESKVEVFRKFVSKLMSLQKQLDPSYHSGKFLGDRLMTAIDSPSIQISLRDLIPRTAQPLTNRIANRLSDKPKTAGSVSINYASSFDVTQNDFAMYIIGQNYRGAARRPVKPFGSKGPSSSRVRPHMRPKQNKYKRLNPSWMRGGKGCFFCGQDHLARQRHSRDEITTAIEQLKSRQPTAFLTVEDISTIYGMIDVDDSQEAEDDAD